MAANTSFDTQINWKEDVFVANPRLPSHPGAVNVDARCPRKNQRVTGLAGTLGVVRLLGRLRFAGLLCECGIAQGGYGAFLLAVAYFVRVLTGRQSVQSVAKVLQDDPIGSLLVGTPDRSTVDRFIRRRRFDWREVLRRVCCMLIALRQGGGEAILAIDETAIRRSGKRIEGAHWVHDGASGRQVWGHQPVGAVYATKGTTLPFDIAFPEARRSATKHDVALEMVEHAVRMDVPFTTVVFDGWYTQSGEFLRNIKSLERDWLGRVKSDRWLELGGRRIQVKDLIEKRQSKTWRHHKKYRRVSYQTLRAELPGVGPVTVLLMQDPKLYDGDVVALVSSDLKARGSRLVRLYKQRWAIECVWRAGKQRLALGECHHRPVHATETHAVFCMMAFAFLSLLRLGIPPEAGVDTVGEVADALMSKMALVAEDDEAVRLLVMGSAWTATFYQQLTRTVPRRTRWRRSSA